MFWIKTSFIPYLLCARDCSRLWGVSADGDEFSDHVDLTISKEGRCRRNNIKIDKLTSGGNSINAVTGQPCELQGLAFQAVGWYMLPMWRWV